MSKPQKICLIHTGGTLGMTGENELEPGNYAAALIEQMPEYLGFANIDSLPLFNLDSADMGPKQWSELAQCISDRRPNYDGFIVIHGTDTMPYTAAALAFALEGLDKPVILTGAQRPLSALRNDARRNLADSIEVATLDIPEVAVCFDGALLRGCRTSKVNTRAYHAFDSEGCEPLARLGVDITLGKHIRRPNAPFCCRPNFSANVIAINVTPGLEPAILNRLLNAGDNQDEKLDGIVLLPFGVGTVPMAERAIAPFVERATKLGIDVLVANSTTGKIDLKLYENSRVLRDAGAIEGGAMGIEAALVKLMHACANFPNQRERHEHLKWNVAGEME